jgi:hypothetical protein
MIFTEGSDRKATGQLVLPRVQSRISGAHNEVQLREGEAPAEPCVSAVQWLGRSLALPK